MINEIINTDINELVNVIGRCILSLITLFLVTKLLGKKQVSELSLFDYVIGISIGNFAAEMTINLDSQILNGTVAVLIFGFIAYFISYLTMKSIWLRRFFMGVPTILIQEGKLLEQSLKEVRFDINDLLEECRTKGYFDISQIQYAVMEVNGEVSILPYEKHRPVTLSDLNIRSDNKGLCANVIIDSKIMKNNLEEINMTENHLLKLLKKRGYKNLDKILLATIDKTSSLVIYERNKEEKILSVLE